MVEGTGIKFVVKFSICELFFAGNARGGVRGIREGECGECERGESQIDLKLLNGASQGCFIELQMLVK
jgi:hypothetical protein